MSTKKAFFLLDNRGMSTLGAVVVIVVSIIVAAVVGALLGYYTSGSNFGGGIKEVFEPPFGGKRVVRILVIGEDSTGGNKSKPRGLSDTIILASIDLDAKRVAAISIPRDTRVDLDGYGGLCKANAAHVYGGPSLTSLVVENLVGIKPDYYVKTNVGGFKQSVDALGGVDIDVEKNMHYRDRRGGLYINLKKGLQHLDGEKAMQYVRFRHDTMGDLARIERQQKFLKALAEKALSPSKLPRLPGLAKAVLRNIETDMSPRDAIYLARFAGKLDMDKVKMAMIPGVPQTIRGASYYIADPEKTRELVNSLFYPQPELPKVEVLNGSGTYGAAQKVADALRERGYEITAVANADSFDYAATEVISRNSEVEGIDQIAGILNSTVVRQEYDRSAKADVTVIVGKDYVLARSGS